MIQTEDSVAIDEYIRLSSRFDNYVVERNSLRSYLDRPACTRRGAREYRFRVLNQKLLPQIQRRLTNLEGQIVTL